jgi:hypothetical protein
MALFERGYVVLECGARMTVAELVAQSPELKKVDGRVTFAGFGMYGFSQHGRACRQLEEKIDAAVLPVFDEYLEKEFPGKELERLKYTDRFRVQDGEQRPPKEKKHVDAPKSGFEPGTATVAGYVNLGDVPLFFDLCPGSQNAFPDAKGHFEIPKEESDKYPMTQVEVPAGHLIIFVPSIVHSVNSPKKGKSLFRKYFGYVGGPAPLMMQEKCEETLAILKSQGNIKLPSGQKATLFPQHYKGALKYTHLPKTEAWIEQNVVGGCSSVDFKDRTVKSLEDLGLMHPPYSAEELGKYEITGVKRKRP